MKLGCILFGFLLLITTGCEAKTRTEITYNEEKDWYQDFFARHLVSAGPLDNKVKIVSDGRFGLRDNESSSFITTFTIANGEKFYCSLDHHAVTTFVVKEIGPDSVTIQYESSFDHRSFGRDLITKDIGTVKIKYKAK